MTLSYLHYLQGYSPIASLFKWVIAIYWRPSACRLLSVCLSFVCLSSVTFVHPSQAVEIFGNVSTFYGVWYLGHPLTSTKNFMEIVPGEPHRQGG